MVWQRFKVFWFSKDNPPRHSERKKEKEVDRRRGEKTISKSRQEWTPAAGHVIMGNLKIISDSRIRSIIAKGPKYRFPVQIDIQKCREKNCRIS